MAVPEKALLDLFYFHPGEWTSARIEQMRFQNLESLDWERFVEAGSMMESPKIQRAVSGLLELFGPQSQ